MFLKPKKYSLHWFRTPNVQNEAICFYFEIGTIRKCQGLTEDTNTLLAVAYIKAAAVETANESSALQWSTKQNTQTHQGTEQVDSLQNELLVSDARDSQLLKFGVANPQQPLPTNTSALKDTHILLQAVVQTCNRQAHYQGCSQETHSHLFQNLLLGSQPSPSASGFQSV